MPIGEIRFVEAEHTVETSPEEHGVRMDVYVNDGTDTVYDVEMQNAEKDNLHLRSRYLLSSFDRDRLARGLKYRQLGKTVVIFICGFDLIGRGERVYAVRPMVEGLGLPFDDGTMRVFLNASGAAQEADGGNRLMAFLSYVDGGGTMGDEWVEELDREVRVLNADRSWRNTVLTYQSIHDEEVEELAEERAKVLVEERAKDLVEERLSAELKGEKAETAKQLASLVVAGTLSPEDAARVLRVSAGEAQELMGL